MVCVCVGIGRFLESTNINQVSRASHPPARARACSHRPPAWIPRVVHVTVVARGRGEAGGGRGGEGAPYRRHGGDNYVFRGHKGVAPVGRVGEAWRRVPRQFATRSERSSLEWPHCARDDPGHS